MPRKIILVRHGETDHNKNHILQGHLDIPLNRTGHSQAKSLVAALADIHVDTIYASDLKRAKLTAKYLAKSKNLQVHYEKLVREHDLGVFQGWSLEDQNDDRAALWTLLMDSMEDPGDSEWCGHGGESVKEFRDRIREFIKFLRVNHQDEVVLVVTHGGTIRRFLEVLQIIEYGGDESTKNTEVITLVKTEVGYTLT